MLVETGISESIRHELPAIADKISELRRRMASYGHYSTRGVQSSDPTDRSRAMIRNQSSNDLFSLMNQCLAGDGRAAIRTARSLFEHEINYQTVRDDADEAHRYCCQMTALAPLYIELMRNHAEKTMQGRRLLQTRHRLTKSAREMESRLSRSDADLMMSIGRRWSRRSLRERAGNLGLLQEYDYYKVFSAMLHGSAIGIVGSHRVYPSDSVVYRTGIAPQLAPIAWEFGLASYRRHLVAVKDDIGEEVTRHFRHAIEQLYNESSEFSRAVEAIDESIWPAKAYDALTLLHLRRNGTSDWYLYNGADMTVAPSLPPSSEKDANVRRFTQEFVSDRMPVILQELDPIATGNDVSEIWVFHEMTRVAPRGTWRPVSTIIPKGQRQIGIPQLGMVLNALMISDEQLEWAIEAVRGTLDEEHAP